MNLTFRTETPKEFNSYCDTTLTNGMTFSDAVDNIERANNTYFYVSACKDDVIKAINNDLEIAEQLDLDLVFIDEIGVYIALQP